MSTPDIIFRFATKEDGEKIYDFAMRGISESILPEFAKDAGENLFERIELGGSNEVAIAEVEHEGIVAYIEYDSVRSIESEVTYIRGVFVLEGFRRMGIGKTLLKMMKKEKCKPGEKLYIDAYTESAIKFWKTQGFNIHHYVLKHNG